MNFIKTSRLYFVRILTLFWQADIKRKFFVIKRSYSEVSGFDDLGDCSQVLIFVVNSKRFDLKLGNNVLDVENLIRSSLLVSGVQVTRVGKQHYPYKFCNNRNLKFVFQINNERNTSLFTREFFKHTNSSRFEIRPKRTFDIKYLHRFLR